METTYYSTAASGDALAIFAAMGTAFILFFVVILVFYLVCIWKIFVKAGQPGWAALIPIYNLYIMLKIINKPAWWLVVIFAGFIPVVGSLIVLAWGIILALEIGRKFGKSNGFSIIALWLFSFVGYPILAFGSAKYDANAAPVTTFLTSTGTSPQQAPEKAPVEPPVQSDGEQMPPTDNPQV